jgi:DNA modification methylase
VITKDLLPLAKPIDKFTPDPVNARKHDERSYEVIANSLRQFGQRKPVVAQEKDGQWIVRAGNGTLEAAKRLGWTEIAAVIVNEDSVTSTAYALADNKTAEISTWDDEILKKTLAALMDEHVAIEDFGFDVDDLGLGSEPVMGLTDDDAAPEAKENTYGVTRGDLWYLGRHRLLCGDSTDRDDVTRLTAGELADMLVTDPPYGVSFVGVKGTMYVDGKKAGKDSNQAIENDDLRGEDLALLFSKSILLATEHTKKTAPFYIFFGINRAMESVPAIEAAGLKIRNWLIWDKGNVGYHAMGAQYKPNFESFIYAVRESPVWIGDDHQQTIWRHPVERLGLHPTMKPVGLITQALQNHTAKSVLDLFLGSGSTLIACEKTGKSCYGMELDPIYCSVIIKRWEEFTGQKATKLP